MAKLNWDKRTAEDKASHLRQPEKAYAEHPVKLKRILALKQIIQRIEKKDWLSAGTVMKQEKRKLSLYNQLARHYEVYIAEDASEKTSKFGKKVEHILRGIES